MKGRWIQILEEYHRETQTDGTWAIMLGKPASEAAILSVEKGLGCRLPASLRELYLECDGYGLQAADGEQQWFLCPLAGIEEATRSARKWFSETHPELAEQFVAYIDWRCGDYSGGVIQQDGNLSEAVYHFEHETYEFDEDQDPEEFLMSFDESLEEFFDTSETPD